MKKPAVFMLAAAALFAQDAAAVVLRNTDKMEYSVFIQIPRKQVIKLKPGEVYENKDTAVVFYLDFIRFEADKDKDYMIKNRKIVLDEEAEKKKAEEAAQKAKEQAENPAPPAAEPAPVEEKPKGRRRRR